MSGRPKTWSEIGGHITYNSRQLLVFHAFLCAWAVTIFFSFFVPWSKHLLANQTLNCTLVTAASNVGITKSSLVAFSFFYRKEHHTDFYFHFFFIQGWSQRNSYKTYGTWTQSSPVSAAQMWAVTWREAASLRSPDALNMSGSHTIFWGGLVLHGAALPILCHAVTMLLLIVEHNTVLASNGNRGGCIPTGINAARSRRRAKMGYTGNDNASKTLRSKFGVASTSILVKRAL